MAQYTRADTDADMMRVQQGIDQGNVQGIDIMGLLQQMASGALVDVPSRTDALNNVSVPENSANDLLSIVLSDSPGVISAAKPNIATETSQVDPTVVSPSPEIYNTVAPVQQPTTPAQPASIAEQVLSRLFQEYGLEEQMGEAETADLSKRYNQALIDAAKAESGEPDLKTTIARALADALSVGVMGLIGGTKGAGAASAMGIVNRQQQAERDKELAKSRQEIKLAQAKALHEELLASRKRVIEARKAALGLTKDVSMKGMDREKMREELDIKKQNKEAELRMRKDLGLSGGVNVTVGGEASNAQYNKDMEQFDELQNTLGTLESLKQRVAEIYGDGTKQPGAAGVSGSPGDTINWNFSKWNAGNPESYLLYQQIRRLAASMLKADQGARPSDYDIKLYMELLQGNPLTSPKQLYELLDSTQSTLAIKGSIRQENQKRRSTQTKEQAYAENAARLRGEDPGKQLYVGTNKYNRPLYSTTLPEPAERTYRVKEKEVVNGQVVEVDRVYGGDTSAQSANIAPVSEAVMRERMSQKGIVGSKADELIKVLKDEGSVK